MGMTEKIKIVLIKRNKSLKDLAATIGVTPQNINGKFKRDNFSERELREIADVLDCELDVHFTLRDTGEKV